MNKRMNQYRSYNSSYVKQPDQQVSSNEDEEEKQPQSKRKNYSFTPSHQLLLIQFSITTKRRKTVEHKATIQEHINRLNMSQVYQELKVKLNLDV